MLRGSEDPLWCIEGSEDHVAKGREKGSLEQEAEYGCAD